MFGIVNSFGKAFCLAKINDVFVLEYWNKFCIPVQVWIFFQKCFKTIQRKKNIFFKQKTILYSINYFFLVQKSFQKFSVFKFSEKITPKNFLEKNHDQTFSRKNHDLWENFFQVSSFQVFSISPRNEKGGEGKFFDLHVSLLRIYDFFLDFFKYLAYLSCECHKYMKTHLHLVIWWRLRMKIIELFKVDIHGHRVGWGWWYQVLFLV